MIIYPTETLYGIGCSAFDGKAIDRIYSVKGRSFNKPMIILLKDHEQLVKWFHISEKDATAYTKIRGKLPTLILRPRIDFPSRLISDEGKIAVRISINTFVVELFRYIEFPVVSTSANISEGSNIRDIDDIITVFRDKVELIIDSGNLPPSKGSTVVDLTVSPVKIVREGDTKVKDMEGFI